jgi:DNA-binding transcriptional LysR family regulator
LQAAGLKTDAAVRLGHITAGDPCTGDRAPGIQQPPLSQQIKALEGSLGTALFHRHPKGVTLTDSGRLFLAEARRILQDMEAMEQRMLRVARGMRGLLAVAFTTSAAAHASPQCAAHPRVPGGRCHRRGGDLRGARDRAGRGEQERQFDPLVIFSLTVFCKRG